VIFCRYCGQQIEWYTEAGGGRIPLHRSGFCSGSASNHLSPVAIRLPCPKCGIRTWLVRSNGGAFWVDELGPPWAKHPCFDGPGFTGTRPFSVGTSRWQLCDFCSTPVPRDQYSDHLEKSCTRVERRKDHSEQQNIHVKSEAQRGVHPRPQRSTEVTCNRCRKTFPESELPEHNWRHHNGPRPQHFPIMPRPRPKPASQKSIEHRDIKQADFKPKPPSNGQTRRTTEAVNITPEKSDHSNAHDFRRDCGCGGEPECIECEGSGWYTEHYDGDFTPGSRSE
jgi:hypothetical protein